MQRNQKKISAGGMIVLLLVLVNTIVLEQGLINDPQWYKLTLVTFPLLLIFIIMFRQRPL